MREKFTIYQRPAKARSAVLSTGKKVAAVLVVGMLGVVGLRALYGPADSAAGGSLGDQPAQASIAVKSVPAPMSLALSTNPSPAPAIDDAAASAGIARSESRTEALSAPQSGEIPAPPPAEQHAAKAEKPVAPKHKAARPQRNNEGSAYAQSTYQYQNYQYPYRANASRWAWSSQRSSGFYPF